MHTHMTTWATNHPENKEKGNRGLWQSLNKKCANVCDVGPLYHLNYDSASAPLSLWSASVPPALGGGRLDGQSQETSCRFLWGFCGLPSQFCRVLSRAAVTKGKTKDEAEKRKGLHVWEYCIVETLHYNVTTRLKSITLDFNVFFSPLSDKPK